MDASTPLIATYRLQLSPQFRFSDASRIISYLKQLGISHLYLSPIFEARPGSTHGYDITDPTCIREELGGRIDFIELATAVRNAGMAIILDIVPNHMSTDARNRWWWDVLKHGRESCFADYFDIDWDADRDNRIVLPVLGSSLEEVLNSGEIQIDTGTSHDADAPVLRYYDNIFPLSPASLNLTSSHGQADSSQLAHLHKLQSYRLMYWRDGARAITYRRFFDINELVCVRVEDEQVFEATHTLIKRLLQEELISGLRVDHVDGLLDPATYIQRLRALMNDSHENGCECPLFIEKILIGDETLPASWDVEGTTGYEFTNQLCRLFTYPAGVTSIHTFASKRSFVDRPFQEVVNESKRHASYELFAAEINRLTTLLKACANEFGHIPTTANNLRKAITELTVALPVYRTYITSSRSVQADTNYITGAIDAARHTVVTESELSALNFIESIVLGHLGHSDKSVDSTGINSLCDFITRWQQTSGPVMAKGLEDTALYRFITLVSLNEVGGEPHSTKHSLPDFHRANHARLHQYPRTLNATATHDTKRGEDTRLRIGVLSEYADEWNAVLDKWIETNAGLRTKLSEGESPRLADEVLIYQSLLGMLPSDPDWKSISSRLQNYMIKATREAKVCTNWYEPDFAYESGLKYFVAELLNSHSAGSFRSELTQFRDKLALPGSIYSLGQVILKATSPGVPDFYQSSELWDLSLVDPDNRRLVDYARLQRYIDQHEHSDLAPDAFFAELLYDWPSGRIKLYVTVRILHARSDYYEVFRYGDYVPFTTTGKHANSVCGFVRTYHDRNVISIVSRYVTNLSDPGQWPTGESSWEDTTIALPSNASGLYRNALTGETVRVRRDGTLAVADAFRSLPLAVLCTVE